MTPGARRLDFDVVIVGYGPVGRALAARLGGAGHRVGVFERFQEIYRLPRAVHIDHEIMRLLRALGLSEVLAEELVPVPDYEWYGADGELLLRFRAPGSLAVRMGVGLHVLPARARAGDRQPRVYPGRRDGAAGMDSRGPGPIRRSRDGRLLPHACRRRGRIPGSGRRVFSNDEANHRIALLAFPNFADDPEKDTRTGMHHSAFEYQSFDDLNASYLRLKECDVTPAFCLDHGMTLSYYYADPDGNNVELQVDCFGNWQKSTERMRTSEEFMANPIGVFVDPDRIAADRAAGMSFSEIHAKAMAGATRRSSRASISRGARDGGTEPRPLRVPGQPDGRRPPNVMPRQSLVYFARDGERLLISTLADRLKARDVVRSGWASICAMEHEPPYPSATFWGPAEILTENIGLATAAIMQRITRADEPPEVMTDEALADVGRVILAIIVERVSSANHITQSA